MATLYFAATTSGVWNTLSNWWQDIAFTVPAAALPTTGDTVYIEGSLTTGPTTAITLGTLYVAQITSGAAINNVGSGISTTGDLVVGKSTYLSGDLGSVSMTIGGNCYFYASSYNYASLTVGIATFSNYSANYSSGHLSGSAVFNGSCYNEGSVGVNATFNDNSSNSYGGTITGNATFNDESENYSSGTVDGNATFNDKSSNSGLISGSATVNYPVNQPLGGTVTGSITYVGYPTFYFNSAADQTWNNVANWWRDSAFSVPAATIPTHAATVYIEGNLTTGPTSAVTLTSLLVGQINSGSNLGSSGAGITVTGNLTVGSGSSTYGRIGNATLAISGNAYFYGTNGGNSGTLTISQSTNFYGSTSNYGIAQGAGSNGSITSTYAVTFNNTSVNYCHVASSYGGIVFNDSSSNANGATAVETYTYYGITFNSNAFNATGANVQASTTTFNNNSYNDGATTGNATFNNSSYNNGAITGNASVYYPVTRPLGGTVTGTTIYYGYPVNYTLYFNAASNNNWNTLANWWTNSSFTTPATAVPKNGDTVYLEGNVTTGPSTALTLAALFIAQFKSGVVLGSSGSGITVSGNLTVGVGISNYGKINAANLTISGAANFYGGGGGNSSTLTVSQANFYLGTANYGTGQGSTTNGVITGNAAFHNNAVNYCSVEGNATFNDSSSNGSGGTVSGTGTFNDSSSNGTSATVTSNATFKNSSSNSGLVSGNASVYYPVTKPLGGTVSGTITYYNYP